MFKMYFIFMLVFESSVNMKNFKIKISVKWDVLKGTKYHSQNHKITVCV